MWVFSFNSWGDELLEEHNPSDEASEDWDFGLASSQEEVPGLWQAQGT